MVFTFLAARGLRTGSSLVESSKVDMARDLEASAKQRGVQILLPSDVVVAQSFPSDACPEPEHRVVAADAITDGWMVRPGMHVGPSIVMSCGLARCCGTGLLWNEAYVCGSQCGMAAVPCMYEDGKHIRA